MNKALFTIIGAVLITTAAIAQVEKSNLNPSPPTPVEVFFGNNRFVSQISFNRKFEENGRLGFLATSYIAADYGNDQRENESVNVALITFDMVKGFGLVSGAALNSAWGFRPFSGLRYFYANQQFFTMVIPGFYLTESHNFETVGIVEYRPHIKNNWSLYSRIEGMYNVDMDTKKHDRSFIYGRLGLNYKNYGFGLAANYDWYGPLKDNKNNIGMFLRVLFK